MAISETDVMYGFLILRKKKLKNIENEKEFYITISEVAKFLNSTYKAAHRHISNLIRKE